MSTGVQARPGSYSWIVRVYAKNDHGNDVLAGCGLVIDDRRVLTCAHVVGRFDSVSGWAGDAEVRVAFPKNDEGGPGELLPVRDMVFPDSGEREDDCAVLYLSGPLPAGVEAAPLRCPEPASLASDRWRVLGFPDDPVGESASGTVEELARGWIRLNKESGDRLRRGFSGSGVWSAEYQAVVAVVTQAGGGDGRALTLRQANALLPREKLGDLARWSLAYDREAEGHWEPRARGVRIGGYPRLRFRGRKAALLAIKRWLDRDQAGRRVLVVTGAPGAGKSAVLARVVTTASPGRVGDLPASDDGIRATAGSVGCAVHAKGKTALEVATEVARAASAKLPDRLEDFDRVLRRALAERRISDDGSGPRPRRFNVIIDALDEAISPEQARIIISKVIMPVAETCADAGAQMIVGSRRTDAEGDLLGTFGSSAVLVDLDGEEFFAREDLAAYALAALQLADREQSGNPYADDVIARPVADRIAELSDGNFLVAGLTAQAHGLFDATPVDPAALSFSPEVTSVMNDYLRRIPRMTGMPEPAELLTALAFAQSPGFPTILWRLAIQTLTGDDVPEMKLARFARSQAAGFLVESAEEEGQDSAFRLFHQALNDALLAAVDPGTARRAEQALTRAFLAAGRDAGWERSPAYLLRSLPAHATRAGMVDDLLADDAYVLHADLRRVLQVVGHAVSRSARDRARLLGLTPEAVVADPADRAAMFSVTEALDGLGAAYRVGRWQVPYRAHWAAAAPSGETLALRHRGVVWAVCAVQAGDRTLLATGSSEGMVRLWDPADGAKVRVLEGHQNWVSAVCAVRAGDRTLLATGSDDGTVRLWDPVDGAQVRVLDGHQDRVKAVCVVRAGDRTLLATAAGGRVWLWDPADGSQVHVMKGRHDGLRALCVVRAGDRVLLAVGGDDTRVRLWDLADGSQVHVLDGHRYGVRAVCVVEAGGRVLLATGGGDGRVRLWDPADGSQVHVLEAHQGRVSAVCVVRAEGRTLLATGGAGDGRVRLWDLADGSQVHVLEAHQDTVRAVCAVRVGDRTLLATGGDDGTVRLWDLHLVPSDRDTQGRQGRVSAVCAVRVGDRTLLATGGDDRTVRLLDPADGTPVHVLETHQNTVWAMCAVRAGNRTLLAIGRDDHTVELWDPAEGSQVHVLDGAASTVLGVRGVRAVCAVRAGDRTLLATGGDDGTVRLLDPVDGTQVHVLEGPHRSVRGVRAVCAVRAGDRTLLATGGAGAGTVRLWDPVDGTQIHVLEGHRYGVHAVCTVRAGGRVLLATGGDDGTVRLWDPVDGAQIRVLEGHQGGVRAVCAVRAGDRTLLVAADAGAGTVRLWDPGDGRSVLAVPVHHAVLTAAPVANSLAVGLTTGVIVIEFESNVPA